MNIMQAIKNLIYKLTPHPMVSYWMTKETTMAKVTEAEDGSYIMWMDGEKYPFPGHPRGHLIVNSEDGYTGFSTLKHKIKNLIFNENWERIEKGEPLEIDKAQEEIAEWALKLKYDALPIEKCPPAVREIARCITHPLWKFIFGYVLTDDDAYRFRFQYMTQFLDKKDPIGSFSKAMDMLENAEIISDMKERVRLIKRVLLKLWEDPKLAQYWIDFVQNIDLKKVRLTKADKYFLRAKYFKADYPFYQY